MADREREISRNGKMTYGIQCSLKEEGKLTRYRWQETPGRIVNGLDSLQRKKGRKQVQKENRK